MANDIYTIAASGMAAQQTQMDLIAANLANVTSSRTSGGPYHTRTAILQSATPFSEEFEQARLATPFTQALWLQPLGNGFALDESGSDEGWAPAPGVEIAGIVEQSPASSNHDQGQSDVDPIEQMVALVAAGRSYDANVAVLQAAKQMDMEASDISRLA